MDGKELYSPVHKLLFLYPALLKEVFLGARMVRKGLYLQPSVSLPLQKASGSVG